jgi:hypothetical protein
MERYCVLAENSLTGIVRGCGVFIDLRNARIMAACYRFGNWSSYLIDTETDLVSYNGGEFYDPAQEDS